MTVPAKPAPTIDWDSEAPVDEYLAYIDNIASMFRSRMTSAPPWKIFALAAALGAIASGIALLDSAQYILTNIAVEYATAVGIAWGVGYFVATWGVFVWFLKRFLNAILLFLKLLQSQSKFEEFRERMKASQKESRATPVPQSYLQKALAFPILVVVFGVPTSILACWVVAAIYVLGALEGISIPLKIAYYGTLVMALLVLPLRRRLKEIWSQMSVVIRVARESHNFQEFERNVKSEAAKSDLINRFVKHGSQESFLALLASLSSLLTRGSGNAEQAVT